MTGNAGRDALGRIAGRDERLAACNEGWLGGCDLCGGKRRLQIRKVLPSGAFAIAGIATAIVVAIYLAFYFFIYLPRGAVQ